MPVVATRLSPLQIQVINKDWPTKRKTVNQKLSLMCICQSQLEPFIITNAKKTVHPHNCAIQSTSQS